MPEYEAYPDKYPVGHTVHLCIHNLNDDEVLEKDEQKYNKILTINMFSDLKYFLAADNELDEASSVSANICDTVCERLFCNAKCTAIPGFHLQYVCTRQVSICKIYAVRQPFNPISDTSEFLIFIFHATISLLLGWGVDIFFDRSEQVK